MKFKHNDRVYDVGIKRFGFIRKLNNPLDPNHDWVHYDGTPSEFAISTPQDKLILVPNYNEILKELLDKL